MLVGNASSSHSQPRRMFIRHHFGPVCAQSSLNTQASTRFTNTLMANASPTASSGRGLGTLSNCRSARTARRGAVMGAKVRPISWFGCSARPHHHQTPFGKVAPIGRAGHVMTLAIEQVALRRDPQAAADRYEQLDSALVDHMIGGGAAHGMHVVDSSVERKETLRVTFERCLPANAAPGAEVVIAQTQPRARCVDRAQNDSVEKQSGANGERAGVPVTQPPARIDADLDALTPEALRRILLIVI